MIPWSFWYDSASIWLTISVYAAHISPQISFESFITLCKGFSLKQWQDNLNQAKDSLDM